MDSCIDTLTFPRYALRMDARTEAILLDQARAGCDQSFESLVNEHSTKMLQLALRLVNNRSDAEEITQEAFIRLYRSLDSFRGECRISTWLYRTVSNLAIDYLRKEKLKRKFFFFSRKDDDFDPVAVQPDAVPLQDEQLISRERLQQVLGSLDALSARQRTVLTLRHQENLPLKEIAEILQLSEGSVKVHLHRAVQALRNSLDNMEKSDD